MRWLASSLNVELTAGWSPTRRGRGAPHRQLLGELQAGQDILLVTDAGIRG